MGLQLLSNLLGSLIQNYMGINVAELFRRDPSQLTQIIKSEADRLSGLLTAAHPRLVMDWPPLCRRYSYRRTN